MNKATNKLASGIRKVKERQAAPAVAETKAVRRPAQRKAELAVKPGGLDGGAFEHPPRVWPD
jgi:BRCT domain type II-containing protein